VEPISIEAVYTGIDVPALSILQNALILIVILPLAAVIGYLSGAAQRRRMVAGNRPVETGLGDTTLGGAMALLGLMLAFSFGHALSTFEARSNAVLVEANAIGTAFQRADFLPELQAEALQTALFDYALTRVTPPGGLGQTGEEIHSYVERTVAAQAPIWPLTVEVTTGSGVPAPVQTFVAAAVTDVLDAHLIRTQSFSVPLQPVVTAMTWSLALIVLFLLGNRTAMQGRAITWRTFAFSAMLWVVMLIILDTQRSAQGFVTVDEGPLLATILDMQRT